MNEEQLIVEIGLDERYGLPSGKWKIEWPPDPRLMLVVVYELEQMLKVNYYYEGEGDKFVAVWKDGGVYLSLPKVDGNVPLFLYVLKEMMAGMARVIIDLDFGSKVISQTSGIVVPQVGIVK